MNKLVEKILKVRIYPTESEQKALKECFEIYHTAKKYILKKLKSYKMEGKFKSSSDIKLNIDVYGEEIIKNVNKYPVEIIEQIFQEKNFPKDSFVSKLKNDYIESKLVGEFALTRKSSSIVKEGDDFYLEAENIGKFKLHTRDNLLGRMKRVKFSHIGEKYYVTFTLEVYKEINNKATYQPIGISFSNDNFITLSIGLDIIIPYQLKIDYDRYIKLKKKIQDPYLLMNKKERLLYRLKELEHKVNTGVNEYLTKVAKIICQHYSDIGIKAFTSDNFSSKYALYNKFVKKLSIEANNEGANVFKVYRNMFDRVGITAISLPLYSAQKIEHYMNTTKNQAQVRLFLTTESLITSLNMNDIEYTLSSDLSTTPPIDDRLVANH